MPSELNVSWAGPPMLTFAVLPVLRFVRVRNTDPVNIPPFSKRMSFAPFGRPAWGTARMSNPQNAAVGETIPAEGNGVY